MTHSYKKIDNFILGLTFTTLIVSFVYYLVWTYKTDNIPNMVKYDIDNIKNAFDLGDDKSNCKEKDKNGECKNERRNNHKQYIEDNCDCPPVPDEEEGNIPKCKPIETNKAKFYYDHSSPKQRLYPKVHKEDSEYLEFIEWDSNKGTDNLQWDRNNGEYRKFADPNYKLDHDKNVDEENKYWTLDL